MAFFAHIASKIKRAIHAVQSGEASRAIATVCRRVVTKVKRAVYKVKCFFRALDWQELLRDFLGRVESLLRAVWRWVKAHPYLTALLVGCVVAVVVPAVVYAPVLGAVGFAAVGPVAGSMAAGVHAATGPIAAGSMFAVLQSAAMGGYGVAVVAAGTQAVAVVAGALALAWAYLNGTQ